MLPNSYTYPSKLLLFGEYTLMKGSQALAIPFQKYNGQWQYGEEDAMQLHDLANYLEQLKERGELLADLDVAAFKAALSKGLFFQSTIPRGYGVGSSGALTAAVFKTFHNNNPSAREYLLDTKKALAQIEDFFHGSSSGIDPLVCYTQKAIWQKSADVVESVELPFSTSPNPSSYTLFLVDTKQTRETQPFVQSFLEKYKSPLFCQEIEQKLIPWTNNAIKHFLSGEETLLFHDIEQIAFFQYQYFDEMILPLWKQIWKESLQHQLFHLKLCGAGGGGFLLGLTKDYNSTREHLKAHLLYKVTTQ